VSFLENPKLNNILRSLKGAYQLAQKANQSCLVSNRKLLSALE